MSAHFKFNWLSAIYAILVSMLCNLNSSCNKPKVTTPAALEITLNPEGLKYIQIPLEKYFIYKDSASGSLDSVVVTKSLFETIHYPVGTNINGIIPAYNQQKY